jgi:hypothetical protein
MIGWHEETDDGDATDVEDKDTDVDTVDGTGNVAPGVLGLTGSDL